MTPTRRRRLRRFLALLLIGPAIVMPWVALQQIQRDALAPTTWLATITAAALLYGLVRFIDSAHR